MKYTLLAFFVFLVTMSSCKKENTPTPARVSSDQSKALARGGGGGGTTTTGPISFVGGAYRLIGGNSDSIQINLTQPAGTGWVMSLSSSNAAVQIPASFPVAEGSSIVHVPITSSVIVNSVNVIITATLLGQSKSSPSFKVFPLHAAFPAPQLQSPGDRSGFKDRTQIKFTWSDNANAYYHNIQISSDPTFSGTPMLEVSVNDPVWAASYFNGFGTRYWRVRYIDGSGTPGPWSSVRSFEIKQ